MAGIAFTFATMSMAEISEAAHGLLVERYRRLRAQFVQSFLDDYPDATGVHVRANKQECLSCYSDVYRVRIEGYRDAKGQWHEVTRGEIDAMWGEDAQAWYGAKGNFDPHRVVDSAPDDDMDDARLDDDWEPEGTRDFIELG